MLTCGSALFPQRERLHDKLFWACAPCKAHVGCHPGTNKPLGTLAKAVLRKLRHDCHIAFDKKWIRKRRGRNRSRKRSEAYIRLAGNLNIPVEQCHFGMFDKKMCARALEVLNNE